MRKRTIVSRGSFEGALTTARVIQQVVDATSTYLGTITLINVGLGALTAGDPAGARDAVTGDVGGIVAVLNYIPYPGTDRVSSVLFLGGLMTYPDVGAPCCRRGIRQPPPDRGEFLHSDGVGKRLTISPLAILVSLSFWSWVWGRPERCWRCRC
jgi:hypothetical protein